MLFLPFLLLSLLPPFAATLPILDVNLNLTLGILGQPNANGVIRCSLKYATAKRWASPVMSTLWTPSDVSDPTRLPKPCPQAGLAPSQFSEDCLDMILYIPPAAITTPEDVPIIVWIHGGSFVNGSATDPGLDGSNLAVGANGIVAVIQYRLGVFGLLPPSSSIASSNLAIQDVIIALRFLHATFPARRVMLAGQSSGATIIRALLGTPEASSLFSNAWLHSDPLDFGFLTPRALETLRKAWTSELGCASRKDCGQDMDPSMLISHQAALLDASPALSPEFFPSSPIRPSPDSGLISNTLTHPEKFPLLDVRKPLVVSTVRDEAAFTVYTLLPSELPPAVFGSEVTTLLRSNSAAAIIVSAPFYTTNASDARIPLQTFGTDMVWRCPTWRLAREWAPADVFVGVFTRGVSYPGNEICASLGAAVVCHQDDIMVLFGTGGQDRQEVRALTREVQARYGGFARGGSPNAPGLPEWHAAGSTDVFPYNLGNSGGNGSTFPVGACTPEFWGEKVLFDYQTLGE